MRASWSIALLAAAFGLALPSVGPATAGPSGQIDTSVRVVITDPAAGAVLQGPVRIAGWAVDPTSRQGTGINPKDVQVWLGRPPEGRPLSYGEYGLPNDEAVAFFGPAFRESGFVVNWNTCSFPAGSYQLWALVSSLARPGMTDAAAVDVTVSRCPPGAELYRADWTSTPPLYSDAAEQVPDGDAWVLRRLLPGGTARQAEGIYADARVEVTAELVGGGDGYYFIDFRGFPGPLGSPTDSFYRFSVHPGSGQYWLGISRPGPEPIADLLTWTPSAALRRGEAPNRLAVEMDGPRLRLYANDVLLTETTNAEFPWGEVRFGTAVGEERTVEARFRDFVITTLPTP
jgi:hypothetical protein